MNEDKESLLESLQDSGTDPAGEGLDLPPGEEQPLEGDLGAMADALLQADVLPGSESESDLLAADSSLADIPNGEENPDAAMAVEEMLSAAMLEEVTASVGGEFSDSGPNPTFQLKISIPRTASRDDVKKIAIDLGLSIPDGTWSSETPMISQLNEFQAISFLQQLQVLGLNAAVDVKRPIAAPTEEDLALGDLSQVLEAPAVVSEGAPSVQLPGNERGVLLYSGDALPAFPVTQTFGVVTAHRSLARRFFRDEELDEKLRREMEKIPGRSASNLPRSRLEVIFREIFLDLQKAALSLGGNAVLGVRIQTFAESSSLDPSLEQMRLVAFGTAAVVEKWDP